MLVEVPDYLNQSLSADILDFCRHVAGSCRIIAACVSGDGQSNSLKTRTTLQVLAVISDFPPRLMSYTRILGKIGIFVTTVDQWVFERDVEKGFLGEALASSLIFPYRVLVNAEYLCGQEVKLKSRLVRELLESLVSDFPELSLDFCIDPRYFMYETMLSRIRLFPPLLYTSSSFLRVHNKNEELENVLEGYSEALRRLQNEGIISFHDGYVKISAQFADRSRKDKARFSSLFKTGHKALFASMLGALPQLLKVLPQNRESILKFQQTFDQNLHEAIEDPENYIYLPTVAGLVPLGNRVEIEDFARRYFGGDQQSGVDLENLGGFLNDVYLVKVATKGAEHRLVVKRFRDLSNFKWFPLTLWSLGTRTFAVLGTSRLERECAINRLLSSAGFSVPRVLHVSPAKRLIFMEFVEGEVLSSLVKRIANSNTCTHLDKDFETLEKVGELFARVHSFGVSIGDSKPENLMVGKDGFIYMMDFEQASRRGDKSWDIAEFLYYAGHEFSPFANADCIGQLGRSFIKGYLKSGGDLKTVQDAGNRKYTKVFSIFTFPRVILRLSSICRKANDVMT